MAKALFDAHGTMPRLVQLHGHNHFSSSLHLNGRDTYLGGQILDFCRSLTPV